MPLDPLYYPRAELAQVLVNNLRVGIGHAFTLFAPRRMGKTQFLLNDVLPEAQSQGFNVFYFSFMDNAEGSITSQLFVSELSKFVLQNQPAKKVFGKISSVNLFGIEVERDKAETDARPSALLSELAKSPKPTLLLLDEIQELARNSSLTSLIGSLRTGLDVNRDKVKAIFTGSSMNGLRKLFNDAKAPFFHFAHAIDFPKLDKDFSDFLADAYVQRTGKAIDRAHFFEVFETLNRTPLYLRAIAQDMIINPSLSLDEAASLRISQMQEQADFKFLWNELNMLDKAVVLLIQQGEQKLYRQSVRDDLGRKLGVESVSTSSVQNALKRLLDKEIIGKSVNGTLIVQNTLFSQWLSEKND